MSTTIKILDVSKMDVDNEDDKIEDLNTKNSKLNTFNVSPKKEKSGNLGSVLEKYDSNMGDSTVPMSNNKKTLPQPQASCIPPMRIEDISKLNTTNGEKKSSLTTSNIGDEISFRDRSSTLGSLPQLTFNLDFLHRDRSNTFGSIGTGRDRSFTFGSDFDLGLGFGNLVDQNLNPNVSGAGGNGGIFDSQNNPSGRSTPATPIGSNYDSSAGFEKGGNVVSVISTNSAASNSKNINGNNIDNSNKNLNDTQKLTIRNKIEQEPFPGMSYVNHATGETVSTSSGFGLGRILTGTGMNNTSKVQLAVEQKSGQSSIASSPGSSTTGYLSGMFGTTTNGQSGNDSGNNAISKLFPAKNKIINAQTAADLDTKVAKESKNPKGPVSLAHTPPFISGSSSESLHISKRMRAGSISGRLRSMSDLEDKGIIDQQQKGALKDLIIAGDDVLQAALDKYEEGDASELQSMIKSGTLHSKMCADVDLLGDLDMDFLNMNEGFGVLEGTAAVDLGTHNVNTNSIPIPFKSSNISSEGNTSNQNFNQEHILTSSSENNASKALSNTPSFNLQSSSTYDGIGDLDFNGEYSGGTEADVHIMSSQDLKLKEQSQLTASNSIRPLHTLSSEGRNRANSLAFGGLLEELGVNDNASIGNWMDRTPLSIAGVDTAASQRPKPLKKRIPPPNLVGLIEEESKTRTGVSLHDQNLVQGDNVLDMHVQVETSSQNCATQEERRILKDKGCLDKKMKRDGKKQRDVKERQQRRDVKSSKYLKSKQRSEEKKKRIEDELEEEPKVVISGTGRPRSLSDPNLNIGIDENGLMHVDSPADWVGAYSPESRKLRIERFMAKRNHRVWVKKVKYDVRKNFADSRLRVKGRFVKKEDELFMRDLMSLT